MHLYMYGFVSGIRSTADTASIEKCIEIFMQRNNLTPDGYCPQTALRTYHRMQKEHQDFLKSNT